MELMDYYVGSDIGEVDDIPKIDAEVWIIGSQRKTYHAIDDLERIRRQIQSKLWCTYRKNWAHPLGSQQLTSDKGWGCMLRCGQMVLAEALRILHLGPDWFWTPECRDPTYLNIVNRFEDNKTAVYSLHQIALMGEDEDKKVGSWFGPNTVAQVLKKLVKFDPWCSLVIHVAMDSILVTDEVYDLCQKEDSWQPVMLVIPLRLGINEINPVYIESLKKTFKFESSLGVIGGKPNQALYFIGYVGEEVLYLDPHTVQRTGNIGEKLTQNEIELDESFHQKHANRINFKCIDPSIAVCFMCNTKESFDRLIDNFQTEIIDAKLQPLFEISKNRLKLYNFRGSSDGELLDECAGGAPEDFEEIKKDTSDEEFEIID